MSVKNLSIDLLNTEGGTQMRAELTQDVYLDYRDKWIAGVSFDPVDVFFDGSTYWLADGFHRFYGAREAKKASIPCRIHNGTQRDAILFACGANASHGLRRTNADKRRAVEALLNDEEWCKWSDRMIAEKAAVGVDLAGSVRKQLSENDSSPAAKAADQPRVGRDGKKRRPPAPKPPKAKSASKNEPVVKPEHDEPIEDLSFDEQVKRANKNIDTFCKQLTAFFEENCPQLLSINHLGRFDSALAHVKAACATLRTCKYADKPCPKCSGDGCSTCEKESDFGAVTVLTYRQLEG